MQKVRFGVLGTGIIIKDFHLPVLRDNPRAEVVALGNHRAESLARLADEYHIRKTYTDFAQMARDPDIDAVVIGLPNYLHASVTVDMLYAGKAVLCEKPMAMTAAEARAMLDAAQTTGIPLMIAHMWRYDQEVRWLRDIVQSGMLGTILKVKAQAVWTGAGPAAGGWFVTPEYAGGGALADMGIHAIDIIQYLFDDQVLPTRVFATAGTFHRPLAVDDTATALVEYDNGMTGVIEAGWYHHIADGPEGAAQVFGTAGYARTFPTEAQYSVGGVWTTLKPRMPARQQQCDLPMYVAQMDHFIECVLGEAQPYPDGRLGLRTMTLLDAAYLSAQRGQAVNIE